MLIYLSQFLSKLGDIIALLTKLVGDNKDQLWVPLHTKSFSYIKKLLDLPAILKLLNYKSADPIFLICNVSQVGVGGQIGQGLTLEQVRPTKYFSKKFNTAQANYSTTDQKLLAIIVGTEYFATELIGTSFRIVIDHSALIILITNNNLVGRREKFGIAQLGQTLILSILKVKLIIQQTN